MCVCVCVLVCVCTCVCVVFDTVCGNGASSETGIRSHDTVWGHMIFGAQG